MSAADKNFFRSLFAKLALSGATVVFCLLLLELTLRVTGLEPDFFFRLDPQVGASYIPNKKGWYKFSGGDQSIVINQYGYRDRNWDTNKPDGTQRIAFLGDSYLAGMEVAREDRVTEKLAALLQSPDNSVGDTEILNFGVTGFGTAQELETLRHRVKPFAPDKVVLFFYSGNDLHNNSLELDPEPNRLHYQLDKDGQLERLPFHVSDNALKSWLRHYSRTYLFLRKHIKRLSAARKALTRLGLMQDTITEEEREAFEANPIHQLQGAPHLSPMSDQVKRSWDLTAALLKAARDEAETMGAQFGVVLVPTMQEILSIAPDDEQNWDMSQSISMLNRICENNDISVLDLSEPFLASGNQEHIESAFWPIDGHWTPLGHTLAAEAIAAWLPSL